MGYDGQIMCIKDGKPIMTTTFEYMGRGLFNHLRSDFWIDKITNEENAQEFFLMTKDLLKAWVRHADSNVEWNMKVIDELPDDCDIWVEMNW